MMNKQQFGIPHIAGLVTCAALLTMTVNSFAGNAGQSDIGPDDSKQVVGRVVSDVSTAALREPFNVGVLLKVAPGWHVYATWPGNTGEPTAVRFTTDPQYTRVEPPIYPMPTVFDRSERDLTAFGYENSLLIQAPAYVSEKPESGEITVSAEISWLACKQKCVGGSYRGSATIRIADQVVESGDAAVFSNTAASFPTPMEQSDAWLAEAKYSGGIWDLTYRIPGLATVEEFVPKWIYGGDCLIDSWSVATEPKPGSTVHVRLRGSECLPFAGGFVRGVKTASGNGNNAGGGAGDSGGNPAGGPITGSNGGSNGGSNDGSGAGRTGSDSEGSGASNGAGDGAGNNGSAADPADATKSVSGVFMIRAVNDPATSPWAVVDSGSKAAGSGTATGNAGSPEDVGGDKKGNDPNLRGDNPGGTGGEPMGAADGLAGNMAWYFLLLAFLGGLLLNVMPCVIPVIVPKVSHLARTAVKYQDPHERRTMLLLNGLAYTAGIFVTMMGFAVAVVALKAAGHQVGWGFQFQNPHFLVVMCAVLLVFSFGMFGIFPLQGSAHTDDLRTLRATRKRGVVVESFFTGLLVTFLGTPCTAPLLGPAVGFAFLAGTAQIFAFFAVLAIGFSLPFLLLALMPGWAAHLQNFRVSESGNKWSHGLSFLLIATLIWLLGVFGSAWGLDALQRLLWFLLVTAAAAWIYGTRCEQFESAAAAALARDEAKLSKSRHVPAATPDGAVGMTGDSNAGSTPEATRDGSPEKSGRTDAAENAASGQAAGMAPGRSTQADQIEQMRRAFHSKIRRTRLVTAAPLVAIVVLSGTYILDFSGTGPDNGATGSVESAGPVEWKPWSQNAVDEQIAAGRPVFVDVTAAWCMNCKTNEKLILDKTETAEMFKTSGTVPFKADFTRRDPEIAALLRRYQRVGVPVYLVYPPCSGEPEILPELLTTDMIRNALQKAGSALPAGCPAK